jgi:hypothetical protein
MYINNSLRITEPQFDIEPAPTGDEIRMFIIPKDFGHISVYLSVAEAESIAFQLSAVIQEMLTAKEEASA